MRPVVLQEDVDEALRLMSVSRSSIGSAYGNKPKRYPDMANAPIIFHFFLSRQAKEPSVVAKLYSLIKRISLTSPEVLDEGAIKTVPMYIIRSGAHAAGFTDEQLQQCLVDYDLANAWSVSDDGTLLKIYS